MSRILVTGGCGFIGSHVVERLLLDQHDVLIVDNLSSGSLENIEHVLGPNNIGCVEEDILNKESLRKIFASFRPSIIVHLAAQPSLIASFEDPINDAMINIIGTLNIAQLAEEFGAKRFVFASTSAADPGYGHYFTDNDLCAPPLSPYGISKQAAEHYLNKISTCGYGVVILRFANIYGPRQMPLGENQLIPRVLSHIYQKTPFEVHRDGKQTRDYLYVKDAANAVLQASIDRYDLGGLFNISSGISTSVLDVLDIIRKETGYKKTWKFNTRWRGRYRVDMPNDSFVNTFDWLPQTSLADGIKETVKAWQK